MRLGGLSDPAAKQRNQERMEEKMNKERILQLADALAASACPIIAGKRLGFDMENFWNDSFGHDRTGQGCGTVGCIAGWAAALFDPGACPSGSVQGSIFLIGRKALGLDFKTAYCLFTPDDMQINYRAVTPAVAAQVLRTLVETGYVVWPDEVARRDDQEEETDYDE